MIDIRYGGILLKQFSLLVNRCAKSKRLWRASPLEKGDLKEKSRQFYGLRVSRKLSGEKQIKKLKNNSRLNTITLAHLDTHVSGQLEANLVLKNEQTGLLLNVLSANVQTLALDRSYKDNNSRIAKLLPLMIEFDHNEFSFVGLQEIRLDCQEVGGFMSFELYDLYYSKCSSNSLFGVGILVTKKKNSGIYDLIWFFISSRIIYCLCTCNGTRLAIFCLYAPTNISDEAERSEYYLQVSKILKLIPKGTLLIFLGDFNARLGSDADGVWQKMNVRGAFGSLVDIDPNGILLLELCNTNHLVVADSLFDRPDKQFGTWKHGIDSSADLYKYAIDHILISNSARRLVQHCGVRPDIDLLGSDHRAVAMQFLCPRGGTSRAKSIRNKRPKKVLSAIELPPKFDFNVLKNGDNTVEHLNLLVTSLDSELSVVRDSVLNSCREGGNISLIYTSVEAALYSGVGSAIPLVGPSKDFKKVNNDWFENNKEHISILLAERRQARVDVENNPLSPECVVFHKSCIAKVQKECRRLKNEFWDNAATRLEVLFVTNKSKAFSESCKIVYGAHSKGLQCNTMAGTDDDVLFKLDGTLTSSEVEYFDRWSEHFKMLLNQKSEVDVVALEEEGLLPEKIEVCSVLDNDFAEKEIRKAIGNMKCGTTGGMDRLETEMFCLTKKSVELVPIMTNLFNGALRQGIVPQQWKDVIITVLHKSKDRKDCNNFRGISLINVIGKILERVIQNRFVTYCEDTPRVLPTSQFGFRSARSTQDCILLSRLISSSAKEMQCNLYKCFVDLSKAYDKVNRDLLWHILKLRGFPPKIIALVRGLMVGSKAYVRVNGILADPFDLECGLKQGSVFAPLLFNIFFGAIIEVFQKKVLEESGGIRLSVSTENGMFFSTHNRGKKYSFETISLCEILFADDAEIVAPSIEILQEMVSTFARVAKAYGQQVSVSKTKVLVVYCKEHVESVQVDSSLIGPRMKNGVFFLPHITVDDFKLEVVHNFKYVGSTESDTADMDTEVLIRKQRMSMAFSSLAGRVFENRSLSLRTKLRVFNSIVVENAIYGCGAWNSTVVQFRDLEMTQFRLLRRILGVCKRDFTSNEMILKAASSCGVTILPLEVVICKRQLTYLGQYCDRTQLVCYT